MFRKTESHTPLFCYRNPKRLHLGEGQEEREYICGACASLFLKQVSSTDEKLQLLQGNLNMKK